MKKGSKTGLEEPLVYCLVCNKDSGARFALHGLCPDGIGVLVVAQKDLIVAHAGRHDETPGSICEDLSAVIIDGGVIEGCTGAGFGTGREEVVNSFEGW